MVQTIGLNANCVCEKAENLVYNIEAERKIGFSCTYSIACNKCSLHRQEVRTIDIDLQNWEPFSNDKFLREAI